MKFTYKTIGQGQYATCTIHGEIITIEQYKGSETPVMRRIIEVGRVLENNEADYKELKARVMRMPFEDTEIYYKNGLACRITAFSELYRLFVEGPNGQVRLPISKQLWTSRAKALRYFHSINF